MNVKRWLDFVDLLVDAAIWMDPLDANVSMIMEVLDFHGMMNIIMGFILLIYYA